MLRSKTTRWVMILLVTWLILDISIMSYPHLSTAQSLVVMVAIIACLGFVVSAIVVFLRVTTWHARR
jgi:hypothetical protein